MSRGDRVGTTKTGLVFGLIAAIVMCVIFIGYGLREGAKYERQANNMSAEYSEYTREKIAKTCVGIPSLEAAKCRYNSFDAQREYEHNQRDLIAQKQSALWAYIMGAAAVIGMALSAFGVWLVKTTFDETRRSNEIAAKTAHNQLRAYVTQQTAKVRRLRAPAGKIKIEATAWVTNNGQTPAYNVLLSVQSFYQKTQPTHDRLSWDYTSPQIIGSGLGWQASATRTYLPDPKKEKRIFVLAEARYTDFEGKSWALYLANPSVDGRNLTKLNCCQKGNYEKEILQEPPVKTKFSDHIAGVAGRARLLLASFR